MNNIGIESRRASSSVSQVSVDDRRQLCEHTRLNVETGEGLQIYGSVAYQLKDANMEASGTCDFVHRALRVVFKTSKPLYYPFFVYIKFPSRLIYLLKSEHKIDLLQY